MRPRIQPLLFSTLVVMLSVVLLSGCTALDRLIPARQGAAAMQPASGNFQATPNPDTALLSEISGEVLARQPLDTDYASVADGYELQARGQIQTLDDGRVRVDTSEGTIVRLGPSSFFTYEGTEEQDTGLLVRLRITLGEIWVILGGGSAEVDTPSGLASVRGSYLSVSVNPDTGEVYVTCLEGHCGLSNAAGGVELVAGQTAVITNADLPPVVGSMSEEDIQRWLDFNPEATLVITPLAGDEEPPEPQEEETPTPTATMEAAEPQAQAPSLTITHDVVCKSGPGSAYDDIRTLYVGTTAIVIGQYPGYWVIEVPGSPGLSCWVPTNVADANGEASGVGQVIAPEKPTKTPKPTRDVPREPANSPTVFENIYGFTGMIYDTEACQNAFLVEVSDADGISAVQVVFSAGDPAFSSPTYGSLMYAEGYWGGTFSVAAGYGDTVYWRIRVTDKKGNVVESATFTYQDMYGACAPFP
ncbi:MAG: FecR domain-containing protein [Anaerolineales bacterium]|nr:FecR domain-containing protein [Anaerolineales bacterium]